MKKEDTAQLVSRIALMERREATIPEVELWHEQIGHLDADVARLALRLALNEVTGLVKASHIMERVSRARVLAESEQWERDHPGQRIRLRIRRQETLGEQVDRALDAVAKILPGRLVRFELGERIRFADTVKKSRNESGDVVWESAGLPLDYSGGADLPPRRVGEGIVVGHRTLSDYAVDVDTEYGEYGAQLYTYTTARAIPGTARRAWLVSWHIRRKPVLVLDTDIEAA